MTQTEDDTLTTLLTKAAAAATLAPSVHNTQPWHLVIRDDALELHADRGRQLTVLDPTGRQLHISCGCALLNIRAVLAEAREEVLVERLPDPDSPDLLARVRLLGRRAPWEPLARLAPQIVRRRTNRRAFLAEEVSPEALWELAGAAEAEGGRLMQVEGEDQRRILAELCQRADQLQSDDPAYEQELRAWTTDDLTRPDGVPAMAVPHVNPERRSNLPLRDFEGGVHGWLPEVRESSQHQCLLLLGSTTDNPLAWLRAGEGLERLWLEATRFDLVASLLTQVVEVPATRNLLRLELSPDLHPLVLLRVGRAPETPAAPRRPLNTVLRVEST